VRLEGERLSEHIAGGGTPPDDSGAPSRSRRRWLAPVLAVLAGLAALALVLDLTIVRGRIADAEQKERARAEVTRTAERFTAQVNNYDAGNADAFADRVRPLLSPKFRADYEKVLDQLSAEIIRSKMTSKGQVLASGVASVDPDSAQVLVVADAAATTVYGQRDRHFRWEVDLVRLGGRWLVDNFSPVN
jgi:Mce-associated membrane protein